MRQVTLSIIVLAFVVGLCGCGRSQYAREYEYQYRAGTEYEYDKLMESYDPASGNPAPLPPLSDEPGEGAWVRVPIIGGGGYAAPREVIVVEEPWCDPWYHPHSYVETSIHLSPRRHYRHSGMSIGFGFGSHYSSGFYRSHPFGWHDPHCWP